MTTATETTRSLRAAAGQLHQELLQARKTLKTLRTHNGDPKLIDHMAAEATDLAARYHAAKWAYRADRAPDSPTPTVGMGCTVYGYSDADPATITRVSPNGRRVWYRMDSAKLLNGPNSGEPDALHFSPGGFVGHTSGTQRWDITPNPDGREGSASLRKDGTWKVVGGDYTKVTLGGRAKHYDYNF